MESELSGQKSAFIPSNIKEVADNALEHYYQRQEQAQRAKDRKEQADIVPVDLNTVTTTTSRSLGPELVADAFWKRLKFDDILLRCGLSLREISLAKAAIIGKLIHPGSDLAIWNWLRNETALLEMLSVDLSSLGKNAIYEITDVILSHKDQLEQHLYRRELQIFNRKTHLFLYDLTNTYFEGQCLGNDLADFGKSKEKRSDCRLVTLALVVDQDGFPVFSKIYGGNIGEPKTLEEILEEIYPESIPVLFPELRPTIVMDRGIATKDNLQLLKDKKFPYALVERRAVEKQYVDEFSEAEQNFDKIEKEGDEAAVYVQKIPIDEGSRVLCLSERREYKERGIDAKKENRFLEDISRLLRSVKKGNIKLSEKVNQRIGRLRERYSSIASRYEITIETDESKHHVKNIAWQRADTMTEKEKLYGCYVIETSHEDLSASEIWSLYTTLTRVENAFRSLKSDLGARPIYHHGSARTEAHLFISVLAYHLLVSIEYTLRQIGDHRTWPTIREQLSTHQRTTVILLDDTNQIYHIRVSGTPEAIHQKIYDLLDVKNPLKRKKKLIGKHL